MRAKGTVLKMLKGFIMEEHGTGGWQRWLSTLPPASQSFYDQQILVSAWYPFEEAVQKPMEVMARLFYGGKTEGNWKEGRYAAEHDLHGIYRVFVRVAHPQFLMRNTVSIWGSYYADSEAQLVEGGTDRAVLLLKGIQPTCVYFDHHVAGWVERALEICGCKDIKISIANPDDGNTRYEVTWRY